MTDKIKQTLRGKGGAGFPLIIAITLSLVMIIKVKTSAGYTPKF